MDINERLKWWREHPPDFIANPAACIPLSRKSSDMSVFVYRLGEQIHRKMLMEKRPCFLRVTQKDYDEFIEKYPNPLTKQRMCDKEEVGFVYFYRDASLSDGKDTAPIVAKSFVDKSECQCKCGCDDKSWYEICANWEECYDKRES